MSNKLKRNIPFHIPAIEKDDIEGVLETLHEGWITTGSKTENFEKLFAEYIGSEYAIALNSGTSALHLCVELANISRGDEVIIPTNTFTATAEVCLYNNAIPKFVDINEKTYNIDTELIEDSITNRTKAIIPVHIGGLPCQMEKIHEIGEKYGLKIIEDAAHAIESEYKNQKIGNISELTAFSFYSTKNLTTGEGGMITTNNTYHADRLKILRLHGMSKDAWKRYSKGGNWYYEIQDKGFKYNPSDILSALGIQQLKKLSKRHEKRKILFNHYTECLQTCEEIICPEKPDNAVHGYHLYIIRLKTDLLELTRNDFITELNKHGIECSVHFIPLHLQPYYQREFGYKKGDFPIAEEVFREIVSLPLYPSLDIDDVDYIVENIKKVITDNRKKSKL